MREYPFPIIDLQNQAWPHVLDVDQPVQRLLPTLAENLGMPRELNYVLLPRGADAPLDDRRSLAEMQVPPGTELLLRPLRDYLLKKLLDKLYDEVKDNIKDQLVDMAKARLKKILDLDPYYPDPLRFKERLLAGIPQQMPPQYQHPQQPPHQPKPRSNVGCVIGGILGGGAVLLVTGVAAAVVLFKVLDAGTGGAGNRSEPVLGTGDVQVTLRWSAPVDIDLHVTDPAGEEIWYLYRTSTSGGNLDVDANANCNSMVANPVENVYWPYGGAPSGNYQVSVYYYSSCAYSSPVNYEITIKQNNQVFNVLSGTANEVGETQFITSFGR